MDNDRPSVSENNPIGYVVATIHVESGFTATIDPTSPDASFFVIEDSKLKLTRSVDYEVSLLLAGCVGQVDNYPKGSGVLYMEQC